jgi:hypothetical protein
METYGLGPSSAARRNVVSDPTPKPCGLCGRTHPTPAPEVESAEDLLRALDIELVTASDIDYCLNAFAAIAQRAREGLQRQLDTVDAALPLWKGTGRGRVETIKGLYTEAERNEFALEFGRCVIRDASIFADSEEEIDKDAKAFFADFLAQLSQGETE